MGATGSVAGGGGGSNLFYEDNYVPPQQKGVPSAIQSLLNRPRAYREERQVEASSDDHEAAQHQSSSNNNNNNASSSGKFKFSKKKSNSSTEATTPVKGGGPLGDKNHAYPGNKFHNVIEKPAPDPMSGLSRAEKVQHILRKNILSKLLAGKSLLVPTPEMPSPREIPRSEETSPTRSDPASSTPTQHVPRRRSTIFDHVARPNPLPQTLCDDDVRMFDEDVNLWEEYLSAILAANSAAGGGRGESGDATFVGNYMPVSPSPLSTASQTKGGGSTSPHPLRSSVSQPVSPAPSNTSFENAFHTASLITGISKTMRRVSEPIDSPYIAKAEAKGGLGGRPGDAGAKGTEYDKDGKQMVRSISLDLTSSTSSRDRNSWKEGKMMRGKSFITLEYARRDSKRSRRPSIHKPDVSKIASGLSLLLSYLIEEPSERMVKTQGWDIFSVPGDKSKIVPTATRSELEMKAGDTVISPKVVEEFIVQLYKICQWTSECHIIAFILIIRLVSMSKGKISIHRYNWQCLLVISLMITQKLWDDVSLNNETFPEVWKMVSPNGGEMDLKDVNYMEREFLCILDFTVTVSMRLYTNCYYEVMSLALANERGNVSNLIKSQQAHCVLEKVSTSHFHILGPKKSASSISGESLSNMSSPNNDESESSEDDDENYDANTTMTTAENTSEAKFATSMKEHASYSYLSKIKKAAHAKYERRNTVDVLQRTPRRDDPKEKGGTR